MPHVGVGSCAEMRVNRDRERSFDAGKLVKMLLHEQGWVGRCDATRTLPFKCEGSSKLVNAERVLRSS